MQLFLFAQSGGLNNSLLWPFLIIIALAIVIWLLSWLLFPDPKPQPIGESLKGLKGLDETMAAKLQRFGIHSDRDLIRLTPRGQQELESQLNLHNGEYAGWRQQILDRWRQAYLPHQLRDVDAIYPDPELGGLYAKKPEEIDDLSKLDGIDHLTANRMNAAGIYTFEQLRLLTPEQRASFSKRFNLTGFNFDSVPQHGVTASSLTLRTGSKHTSGRVASSSSPAVSTETNLVSGSTGSTGQASGSSSFNSGQSASTSGIVSNSGSIVTSGSGVAASATSSGSVGPQIPTSKVDAELGRVYSAPPPHRDDLTKLDGIDDAAARKLNEAGVYTVDQLLSLSPSQQAGFKRRFDLPQIDFGKWRLAARPPHDAYSTESATSTSTSGIAATTNVSSAGGNVDSAASSVTSSANAPSSSLGGTKVDLGYLYVNPPHNADDLTQLDGITPAIARQLNLAGIYRFHQINTMSSKQRENFKSRFALPNLDFGKLASITQEGGTSATSTSSTASSTPSTPKSDQGMRPVGFAAATSHSATSPASTGSSDGTSSHPSSHTGPTTTHPRFGNVYSSPPTENERDDLSRLAGIDAATEKRLNTAGIYNFAQLQGLSGEQFQTLKSEFGIEGIDFADWKRCMYAWKRGIDTTPNVARNYRTGWLHGVRLPEVATGVFDGKQLVAYPEQVVFRGSNAEHWGTSVSTPDDGIARSLSANEIRSDVNYVRIRRVDTRDSVVTSITKGQLFAPGPNEGNGWNGLCESFFGGRHLGVFARDIPNEVETRFGLGGWGFGHRFDQNDQQEWAWQGLLIEPTTFEISVGRIGSQSGTVVFRSNDPTIWNSRVRRDSNHFAMPIDGVTHPVSFLRLLRIDTGEAVVIRVDRASLLRRGENPRLGWNGLCDEFSGGHHLGIYHRDAPQSVEICYGEGGWGFGHPYNDNNRQAYGWGGNSIGGSTVFEVSVLDQLPDYLRHELME